MTTHLEIEISHVKSDMFKMMDLSVEAIQGAVCALVESDSRRAEEVIRRDSEIDQLEILIDNECVTLLVTRQPAAVDLRLVLAALKINTDLERIADLASNIAKEVINLNGVLHVKPLVDLPRMAEIAVSMIKDTFRSITEKDSSRAFAVIKRDAEIDQLNMQVYRELFSYMAEKPEMISDILSLIMISKMLERIGDHITNIAERAVFYIEGADVRHQ